MTDPNLIRFIEAPEPVLEHVERELRSHQKRIYWMWFIFPQFTDFGHSTISQHFGIDSHYQARSFLADPLLGKRLRTRSGLVAPAAGAPSKMIVAGHIRA